jgi:small subunit ribosomal protein S18
LAEYENSSGSREAPGGAGPSEERRGGGDSRRSSYGQGPRGRRDSNRRQGKVCQFCAEKAKAIDYKDTLLLRQYINERGRIFARRKTGTCAKHQRMLASAIKRARTIALLPYTAAHVRVQSS